MNLVGTEFLKAEYGVSRLERMRYTLYEDMKMIVDPSNDEVLWCCNVK